METLATNISVGSEQIAISGDDILIEYCERILNALTKTTEFQLNPLQSTALIKFITHKVWSQPDKINV